MVQFAGQKSTGMKHTASAKRNFAASGYSTRPQTRTRARRRFVVCILNSGYPVSLELGKIYEHLPDAKGAEHGYIRVIDESGEDYLYPSRVFLPVAVSPKLARALRRRR